MTLTHLLKRSPPDAARYDRDLYSWALEQAALLAEGRVDGLDFANLAEEIGDLARAEFRAFASAYRVLLQHMLKWDHQPQRRSRSWQTSIALQRVRLDELLADSPGLKPRVDEAISRGYRQARLLAAKETKMDIAEFPLDCPYDAESILTRPFELG